MNDNDIIRMALEYFGAVLKPSDLEVKLAALAVAQEREACAKVCEDKVEAEYATGKVDHNEMAWTQFCAIAIRARGEAKPYATQAAMVESQTQGRMQMDPATGDVSIGAIRARGEAEAADEA